VWFGIAWTIISSIGLGFYGALTQRAYLDLHFIHSIHQNGLREAYIRLRLTMYIGLALVNLIYFGVGISYIFVPSLRLESIHDHSHFFSRIALLSTVIVLTIMSYRTNRRREHLIRLIMEREDLDAGIES
jgi:hypothetical protein